MKWPRCVLIVQLLAVCIFQVQLLRLIQSVSAFTREQPFYHHYGSTSTTHSRLQKTRLLERTPESYRQSYSEKSRRYRRTYYGHNEWLKHRSSDRFLRNLQTIFDSGVAQKLIKEVSAVATVALVTLLWNTIMIDGYADFQGVQHEPLNPDLIRLTLPLQPFTLSSSALGLLLVFRTNASYSRWLDSRKSWGMIVNHSRSILRMTAAWCTKTDEEEDDDDNCNEAKLRLANAVWAFPRSLQRHLYGEREDEERYIQDVQQRLPKDQAQALIEARHKPTRALYDLSVAIDQLPIEQYLRRNELERSTTALCDAAGACERIFSSPIPLLYARHTSRFLSLWLLLLPLALYEPFSASWDHLAVLPATILIAYFLYGIDELAIQLEEPFSILPIQTLVDGIELSAKEHLEWHLEQK